MYITYVSSVTGYKPCIHFITTLTPTLRQNNVMVKKNFFQYAVSDLSVKCVSTTYQLYV